MFNFQFSSCVDDDGDDGLHKKNDLEIKND